MQSSNHFFRSVTPFNEDSDFLKSVLNILKQLNLLNQIEEENTVEQLKICINIIEKLEPFSETMDNLKNLMIEYNCLDEQFSSTYPSCESRIKLYSDSESISGSDSESDSGSDVSSEELITLTRETHEQDQELYKVLSSWEVQMNLLDKLHYRLLNITSERLDL